MHIMKIRFWCGHKPKSVILLSDANAFRFKFYAGHRNIEEEFTSICNFEEIPKELVRMITSDHFLAGLKEGISNATFVDSVIGRMKADRLYDEFIVLTGG